MKRHIKSARTVQPSKYIWLSFWFPQISKTYLCRVFVLLMKEIQFFAHGDVICFEFYFQMWRYFSFLPPVGLSVGRLAGSILTPDVVADV